MWQRLLQERLIDIKKKIAILCALLIVFSTTAVYAIPPSPPAIPWRLELGDDLTFYMVSRFWHNFQQLEEFEIFEGRRSGLYRGDELVYAIEGNFFFNEDEIFISRDGLTFLRIDWFFTNTWPDFNRTEARAHIFHQGQILRVFYLVEEWSHNHTANTLEMTTGNWNRHQGRELVIDLYDISILSERFTGIRIFPHGVIIWGVVLVAVSAVFVAERRSLKGNK